MATHLRLCLKMPPRAAILVTLEPAAAAVVGVLDARAQLMALKNKVPALATSRGMDKKMNNCIIQIKLNFVDVTLKQLTQTVHRGTEIDENINSRAPAHF